MMSILEYMELAAFHDVVEIILNIMEILLLFWIALKIRK